MATKTKQTAMGASPFDALAIENGVVILNNTEPIDQAKPEPAPKKKAAAKKKADEVAKPEQSTTQYEQPKEETVERKSFDEIVREMDEREAELNKREAELKATAERLKNAAEMIKAAEETNNKEKETMAEKKETPAVTTNLENLNIEELIKKQHDEFDKMTVKVETEDCWTQTKKGFCMGAGAAAGAGLVIGALSLIASCFGGGSAE